MSNQSGIRFSSGMPMRDGWVEVSLGMSVPIEAVQQPPHVNWRHIDGPLMTWAGHLHWLTWRQRLALWFGRTTLTDVACKQWPHLAAIRAANPLSVLP